MLAGCVLCLPLSWSWSRSQVPTSEGDCKQYAAFAQLQHYALDFTHAPSAAVRCSKVASGAGALPVTNVRGTIECQDCGKLRAYYSKDAWRNI